MISPDLKIVFQEHKKIQPVSRQDQNQFVWLFPCLTLEKEPQNNRIF